MVRNLELVKLNFLSINMKKTLLYGL